MGAESPQVDRLAEAKRFLDVLSDLLPLETQLIVGEKQTLIQIREWEPIAKLQEAVEHNDDSPRRVKNWYNALLKDGLHGYTFFKTNRRRDVAKELPRLVAVQMLDVWFQTNLKDVAAEHGASIEKHGDGFGEYLCTLPNGERFMLRVLLYTPIKSDTPSIPLATHQVFNASERFFTNQAHHLWCCLPEDDLYQGITNVLQQKLSNEQRAVVTTVIESGAVHRTSVEEILAKRLVELYSDDLLALIDTESIRCISNDDVKSIASENLWSGRIPHLTVPVKEQEGLTQEISVLINIDDETVSLERFLAEPDSPSPPAASETCVA